MKRSLPWWLWVIIVLETLPMFVGPLIAVNVPPMMGGPGAEELNQAAFIYAARNLAVGFALIIAALLRNPSMLFILIFVRLFTDLIDLPTLLHFGLFSNPPLSITIFVVFYYIPAVVALWYLWRHVKRTNEGIAPETGQ